jgi:hypothetical protein
LGTLDLQKKIGGQGDIGFILYQQSTPVVRKAWSVITVTSRLTGASFVIDPTKGRVTRLQRRLHAWAELVQEGKRKIQFSWAAMVTLTYQDGDDWRAGHIKAFLKWSRKYLGKQLIAYAWVAELQKRGAIHYHVLLVMLRGRKLPKPDESGHWPYGMSRIEKARSMFYICKYTSKGAQHESKSFPKGARIFGCFVSSVFGSLAQWTNYHLSTYPKWLREIVDSGAYGAVARPELGGGWRVGKYLFQSPYTVVRE